ncbi:MAG: DedA family protein [Rhodospirillales bacterium]|nr:DedA family protein [Alphaproteobacteria bacterium]MCB1840423.1 DedA family protein [Alphaproteobacteria bacterium]MCB9977328.1 DedA family protein [Rhodospirillales bacterium]
MTGPELVPFIKSIGYLGILISIILENGVILFFFMPSDSLLFTAGFLASQGILELGLVIVISFIGSVLGYMVGYWLGEKAGPAIRAGKAGKHIDEDMLNQAKQFYNRYASWALVVARFFPIRAFVSLLAGASEISYRTFMIYNVIGGAVWTVSLTLLGYYCSEFLAPDDLDKFFIVVFICFLVTVGAMMTFLHLRKAKIEKAKKAALTAENSAE